MKTIYFLAVLVLFSAFAKAQDDTKVEVPRIIMKAFTGKSIPVESTSVMLVQVLEDSRCPKDVQCVWAGQAKVEVLITDGEGTKSTKVITVAGGAASSIYTEDGFEIMVRGLAPYPVSTHKIASSDYYLKLEVKRLE